MTRPFVEENFRITLLRLLENAFVKLYLLLWYDPIISPLMQKTLMNLSEEVCPHNEKFPML